MQHETDVLRSKLKKLPDLEKLLAKIYSYSIKHHVKAIYFEDISLQKMKDYRALLTCFRNMQDILGSFTDVKSKRLQLLLTFDSDDGLVPSGIEQAVDELDKYIVWKRAANDAKIEIAEPQKGIDEQYDYANEQVNKIKTRLDQFCE